MTLTLARNSSVAWISRLNASPGAGCKVKLEMLALERLWASFPLRTGEQTRVMLMSLVLFSSKYLDHSSSGPCHGVMMNG